MHYPLATQLPGDTALFGFLFGGKNIRIFRKGWQQSFLCTSVTNGRTAALVEIKHPPESTVYAMLVGKHIECFARDGEGGIPFVGLIFGALLGRVPNTMLDRVDPRVLVKYQQLPSSSGGAPATHATSVGQPSYPGNVPGSSGGGGSFGRGQGGSRRSDSVEVRSPRP